MEVPSLADLISLDDSALIAWRRETHGELAHNPDPALRAVYDATTREVASRAGDQWTGGHAA